METVIALLVLGGFGYFIYTRVKKSEGAGGGGGGGSTAPDGKNPDRTRDNPDQ